MDIEWTSNEWEDGLLKRRFMLARPWGRIPGVLWSLPGLHDMPLILHGHGGSQQKDAPEVQELARLLAVQHGFASAAIDGPVHGERRTDGVTDRAAIRDEFLALWAVDNRIDAMVRDWRAALDALVALPEIDAGRIGWCGVSMGTAYGLPLCAVEPRIRAALLGMWSGNHPNSDALNVAASRVRCPVMFQQKWDDTLFDREGQLQLFTDFASADKRLCVYPGGHSNPQGEQQQDILRFLASRLGAGA